MSMPKRMQQPSTRGRGRPTKFSDELAATICRRLADGESLRRVCESPDMPSRESVRAWLRDNSDFRDKYAIARQDHADALSDEAMEAVRGATDAASASVARVKLDAIRWIASKLNPKIYGDKIETTTNHRVLDGAGQPHSIEEIARHIAFLFASAQYIQRKRGTPGNDE